MSTRLNNFRYAVVCGLFAIATLFISAVVPVLTGPAFLPTQPCLPEENTLYSDLHLSNLGLSRVAYETAIKGWKQLKKSQKVTKGIISICDFTQSSACKRLYVIDLSKGILLFNTFVAHGKNSGTEYARSFSNNPESLQTSLGFYVTGSAFNTDSHGLCLKLQGMEPGYNDKAEERSIIIHGAWYADEAFLKQYGILGRSFGCPAVPTGLHKAIINTIKEGACLFIYYPDKNYLSASKLLQ